MERRKFVYTTLAASSLPLMAKAGLAGNPVSLEKELFEIRTYDLKFGANRQFLEDYLRKVLGPALMKKGVTHFMLLGELGMTDPPKLRVIINYPSPAAFIEAQNLQDDPVYMEAAADYNQLSPEEALYTRFTSSLLLAFDGMPKMKEPVKDASLFELRTYEGYSEDAVRRKIRMFNNGEMDIFQQTGFHPVFYGEMIVGPYRPCLTYMLSFKDMAERDALWKGFGASPAWKEISTREEYANTVSNIHRIFLQPLP